MMADIPDIYNVLLSRNYQEQLFSHIPGARKIQGRETLTDCPFCHKEGHFSYSKDKPFWRCWSCGESGDWIKFLEKSGSSFQDALSYLANAAGVQISSQNQAAYQSYTRKADILEAAHKYMYDELNKAQGKPAAVYQYLLDRGYLPEDIKHMEVGAYTDKQALQDYLLQQGYTQQEIKESGLLTKGFGDDYQLTLLWRDQAGRALGMVGRPIMSEDERKLKGLEKYKYSFGLKKDQGLIGFSLCRGSSQIILVEGVLDALYLYHKGFKVVAVGGTTLSKDQQRIIEAAGTKELLLAMDMDDPGQKATEAIIRNLQTSSLRAYVISLPDGCKDPDELVRKKGAAAFQGALDKAERWPKWLAKRIVSKHDITTDRGLDQALEQALAIYTSLEDKLEARDFRDTLRSCTGLSEEDLAFKLQEASQKASVSQAKAILIASASNIQQKASQGDLAGAELELERISRELRSTRGVDTPEPYLVEELISDITNTTPALATGYKRLDDIAKIPTGAITIIAGRPGQGKTTFQLNLLVNMLKAYPDKKFYFFSYEEARKAIATKLIMILAGVELNSQTNYGAYVNYIQEKRGSNKKIDKAIQEFGQLTTTGRLLISDKCYAAEDLASVIELLAKGGDTGAVIVDYIQRIPLLRPSQSQRYLDIKQVSALLLEQAKIQDLPIILGAQLGRDKANPLPRLDNLRESGDIEQDASLVLGLYNEAEENKASEDPYDAAMNPKSSPTVDLKVFILKNRVGGGVGRSYSLTFNRPILTITEQSSKSSTNSIF